VFTKLYKCQRGTGSNKYELSHNVTTVHHRWPKQQNNQVMEECFFVMKAMKKAVYAC